MSKMGNLKKVSAILMHSLGLHYSAMIHSEFHGRALYCAEYLTKRVIVGLFFNFSSLVHLHIIGED